MDVQVIGLLIVYAIIWIPLILILVKYGFLKKAFDISISYAQQLGFLISVNGAIRSGKTSFQSGLKHIFEIIIENMLLEKITTVRRIFKSIDFTVVDIFIDEYYQGNEQLICGIHQQQKFDEVLKMLLDYLDSLTFNMYGSIINNLLSNKTSKQLFEDYIFSYWVYYYRRNYVQSKTIFYSHITSSFSMDYNVEQTKINKAYELKEYAIYDYMVELVDEASDDIGQNQRFKDIKEEDGDKDYRRKFGQIHQERNWQITTKQDVKDEVAKFRRLTQSNIWIPERVSQRGTNRFILSLATFFFHVYYFFYDQTYMRIKSIFKNKERLAFVDYLEQDYKRINMKRDSDNWLLHLDWFLKAAAYNRYDLRIYANEEDVKSNDPLKFTKQVYYIPTRYCWGTYDTHKYRSIEHELLLRTKIESVESNWFDDKPYFEEKKGEEHDNLSNDFKFE